MLDVAFGLLLRVSGLLKRRWAVAALRGVQ